MARLPSPHTASVLAQTTPRSTTPSTIKQTPHKQTPHKHLPVAPPPPPPQAVHHKRNNPKNIPAAIQQRLRSRRRDALAPDFDVRETASAFYLEGELPGVADTSAVRLDWIDRRTLSIDAVVEKVDLEAEWGLLRPIRVPSIPPPKSPKMAVEGLLTPPLSKQESSSGSDVGEEDMMAVDEGIEAQPSKPVVREWLSERRVGHYQRTFTFPTDVDASAIRARLGQGLLRVLVPKVVRTSSGTKQVKIEDCE